VASRRRPDDPGDDRQLVRHLPFAPAGSPRSTRPIPSRTPSASSSTRPARPMARSTTSSRRGVDRRIRHGPEGARLACTACHDVHGSTNAYMLREQVVSPDGRSSGTMTGYGAVQAHWDRLQGFCLGCHTDTDPEHGRGDLCTTCTSIRAEGSSTRRAPGRAKAPSGSVVRSIPDGCPKASLPSHGPPRSDPSIAPPTWSNGHRPWSGVWP